MHFKDLSSSQKSVPLKGLLCNWPDCKAGPNGKRALAQRLCPCCQCVGYCCVYCMKTDWKRHHQESFTKNVNGEMKKVTECQRVCPKCKRSGVCSQKNKCECK